MASRKPRPSKPRKSATGNSGKKKRPSASGKATPSSPTISSRVPIVGIGASAGGFEALEQFFSTVPPQPNVAFIVIQHLDPNRISEMPALLGRRTQLRVEMAHDGVAVEPNVVYTIPPGRYLSVEAGRIRITLPAEPRGLRLPVDVLFYSMAQSAAEGAIGVILSGTGADGTLGLRAIKGHGGLGIVQDPATAEYDGMPRNAIATGLVDFILPPSGMAEAILRFVNHDYVQKPTPVDYPGAPGQVDGILALLHARRNVDFSGYKKGTLIRRIDRRMSLRHLTRRADYHKLLRESPDEVNALFNDLLIQVTRFFREPESWKILETDVLPRIIEEADRDQPVRVWVPGCASGEEAYSMAILLLEKVEASQKRIPIQVFASDLDRGSLDQARAGTYPDSIVADVSQDRLDRFFTRMEHRYVVSQVLRETVIFAQQNMLVDPPFSRLDLVSCRNVLIYLEAAMQRRALELFHFGLKPGRFLILGNSETIGAQVDLFQPLSKRSRIYRRLGSARLDRLRVPTAGLSISAPLGVAGTEPPAPRQSVALSQARELVLERYTAAIALLNRRMEILSLFGPTHTFLSQPSGPLSANILAWVREGVRSKLRVALQAAIRKNETIVLHGLKVPRTDPAATMSIRVEPLTAVPESDGLLLVVFSEDLETVAPPRGRWEPAEESLVHQLEYELKLARDELQASVEQMESSNEELRATNEEILSMNEELQSANEEMETSKEELQSVNEELSAVNSQLEAKLGELQAANDDITNLLTSTDLPVLFLDRDLLIRRYTPAIARLFRLIGTDLGRPLSDISNVLEDSTLMSDAAEVLIRLSPIEKEVTTQGGEGFIRRVRPYRTEDDRIEGVVITYSDISERIRADLAIRESRDFAEAIVETLREPLLVLDDRQVVRSANAAFYRAFQLSAEHVLERRIYDIGNREWDIADFRRMLETAQPQDNHIDNLEIRRDFAGVGERVICVNARTLGLAGQRVVLVALEDITHRLEAERTRTQVLRELVRAEEKERHRLALELHDETGQHVTAFLLGLATLKATYAGQPENRALIENLQERAEELARHLHGISLQLRPTALDDHGLERALANYVEDISLRHGVEVDLHADKSLVRLPSHIETVLYRVTQEALTNVLKHSRASKVSVILARNRKEVSLIVEDNGAGFEPEAILEDGDTTHLGLRGMRERVMLAGGTLAVESEPGSGTSLFARIPLQGDTDGNPEK